MNIELPVLTLALWFFFARKFSMWGWVEEIKSKMPSPLKALWQGWQECAFCGGFWISLVLKALTGWTTVPAIAALPFHWAVTGFLDGLVTSMVVLPAALAVMIAAEHLARLSQKGERETAGKRGSQAQSIPA